MTSATIADRVRLASGTLDLLAPAAMATIELAGSPLPPDLLVYRVLGMRQLAQAWLVSRTGWRGLGAAVDAAHLLSMVPVAVRSRRWRRAAIVQIVVAGTLLVAGLVDATGER